MIPSMDVTQRVLRANCLQPLLALLIATFSSSHAQLQKPQDVASKPESFRTVTINNVKPRRDVDGEIVDAHDGCLQFFIDRYYLYGTAYGKSAGFGINNRFRVYSSPDLERWQFEGELIKEPPRGVFYRPCVAYNAQTRKYVLWFNWYPQLWDGQIGTAVSDSPIGPFTMASVDVKLTRAANHPGDGSLFVDDDGIGYFIYTVIGQDHAICIERLTPDFLASSGKSGDILARGCEAPAMFRRGNFYYALFDTCCCFCLQGSGARVYVATSPLGPYSLRGNINRDAQNRPLIAAQQTFVARIPTSNGDAYIWMGDQWGSRTDHIKGHDRQYWSAPLQFTPDDGVLKLEELAAWHVMARIGQEHAPTEHPYIWPKIKDPNPLKVDPCTQQPIPPEEWDTGERR